MNKQLYYIETGLGCGIRAGTSEDTVYENTVRSAGTSNGPFRVRLATEADISSVKAMGGYIPELT